MLLIFMVYILCMQRVLKTFVKFFQICGTKNADSHGFVVCCKFLYFIEFKAIMNGL